MKIVSMNVRAIGMVFCLSLFGFAAEGGVYAGLFR
jgi:hypothetical protein